MKLNIVTIPDPILKKKAEKVSDPKTNDLKELVVAMFETMKKADGIGLAAPQIGKSIQLCVIELEGIQYVLFNPKITAKSWQKAVDEEGCLSCPETLTQVERPERVKVRYTDQNGQKQKLKARGMLSRVLQHEIDHLNGILIIDKK